MALGGEIGRRVTKLERDMKKATGDITELLAKQKDISSNLLSVQQDTSDILAVVKNTKGVVGFITKWGRAIIIAAIGAGLFNPTVSKFLSHLFSI